MSRAMPKSPILATRPAPLQVSKQLRAAMSLKDTGSTRDPGRSAQAQTDDMQTFLLKPKNNLKNQFWDLCMKLGSLYLM